MFLCQTGLNKCFSLLKYESNDSSMISMDFVKMCTSQPFIRAESTVSK